MTTLMPISPADAGTAITDEPLFALPSDRILVPLGEARADSEGFKIRERDWLRKNIGPLLTLIENTFEYNHRFRNEPTAYAALQGGYLGASVVRLTVEAGEVSASACKSNMQELFRNSSGRPCIDLGSDIGREPLAIMYGTEAADAFGEIVTPVSRTVSALVIGFSLLSDQAEQL